METRRIHTKWLAAILLSAAALRLLYWLEFRTTPFADHLFLDLAAYDAWAQRIAQGDWLGSSAFYQDPLYPYFLGTLYAVFGRNLTLVYLLQALLGTVACYLIYLLGRRLVSPAAGLVAAALAAVYQPFIFYDIQIEKTSLAVLAAVSSCLLLVRALDKRGAIGWVVAGMALGLATLLRGNYLLLLPLLVAGIVITDPGTHAPVARVRAAAWYVAGVALILGVTLMRNYIVAGDLVLTTAQAGQNLYIGNNAENASAVYQAPSFVRPDPRYEAEDFAREAERRAGRTLAPSEVSRYWLAAAASFIASHPQQFLTGLARKAAFFWNAYEIPDNLDFYLLRNASRVLQLPLSGFAFVAGLGLYGMAWEAGRHKRLWPLYVFSIGYFLTAIPFFVSSRYRLLVVPPLLVFAGAACCRIADRFRDGGLRRAIPPLAIAAVVVAAAALPMADAYNPQAHLNLGSVLMADGHLEPAEDLFRNVIAMRPQLAEAHNNLAVLLVRRGDDAGAGVEFSEAIRLRPEYPDAYLNLGRLRLRTGELDAAERVLDRARTLAPDSADAWSAWASLQFRRRNPAGALEASRRAVALDPSSAERRNNLAIALIATGDPDGAIDQLDEALRQRPGFAEAHFNRALSLERVGRTADALEGYRRAIAADVDYAEAYANLGNLLLKTGERGAAIAAYQGFLRSWTGDDRFREAIAARVQALERQP